MAWVARQVGEDTFRLFIDDDPETLRWVAQKLFFLKPLLERPEFRVTPVLQVELK